MRATQRADGAALRPLHGAAWWRVSSFRHGALCTARTLHALILHMPGGPRRTQMTSASHLPTMQGRHKDPVLFV
jgi:hypothetical protein